MTAPDPDAEFEAALAAAERAVDDLKRLAARAEQLHHDIAVTREHVEDIRHSRSWRALELYRRLRAKTGLSSSALAAAGASLRSRRAWRRVPRGVRRAPLGVNVSGYLDTESGMGEAARASIRALEAAGVPIVLNNVPSILRAGDTAYRAAFQQDNPHPFNLVHLNADNMPAFRSRRGRRYFRNRYTIGYWFWELSTLRDDWVPFAGYVDEVWVATRFVQQAVEEKCAVITARMPLPVVLPPVPPRGRAHFGIKEGAAVFLYIFDVSSQTERKNPLAAIRAFRRAGLRHDQATLVLKFTNAEYDRSGVRQLHEEAAGLNVLLLEGYLDRPDLIALVNAADCYLSPHRAEGFGLTLLEAMRLGKPVIATGYSGNMDFMTEDNSYILNHRLVTLTRDYGPYTRGAVWADPDIDHAAQLIRHVAARPAEAASRGERARQMVERDYSPLAAGTAMRQRLARIQSGAPGDA